MSHVASQETRPGEPLYADVDCLVKAAGLNGFERVDTPHYNWFNRHVGDYPIPAGMGKDELGHNALFVLRIKEPQRSAFRKRYGQEPYDVGVIADPNNPGCYTIVYDFFAGGYGVDTLLGEPARDPKNHRRILMLCPLLKQAYDMVCDAQAAQESGDQVTFMSMAEARKVYPAYFAGMPAAPAEVENKTWVSVAQTSARVGVR